MRAKVNAAFCLIDFAQHEILKDEKTFLENNFLQKIYKQIKDELWKETEHTNKIPVNKNFRFRLNIYYFD